MAGAKRPQGPPTKPAGRRYGPGRPTLEDLERRKSSILDIATSFFIQRGFAETSLVDIAKQAGVATRTIYQHYGDKEAIFRAVIDRRIAETDHVMPKIRGDQKLFDALVDTAHYICAVALDETGIQFQRLMIAESQRFPDLMRQIFESLYTHFHSNIATTFEQLAAARKIPAGNHTETTKYFVDFVLGTAPMQISMNWIKSGPSEREIRDKVALFSAGRFGLEPEAGSPKRNGARGARGARKTRSGKR